MKILYVDQTGKLGGGELALLPWLEHAPKDAAVVLFDDGPFRQLIASIGIPVQVLSLASLKGVRRESGFGKLLSTLPALWNLRTRLARIAMGYDLLYANSQKAFLVSALARRKGQPLVWHLRDILTAEHFSPMMRRVAVTAGNRWATVIVVNSQATADALIASGGRAARIRVVHDGVSPAPFDRVDPATVARLRAEIGAQGKPLIGLFGRLSPWKGQHVLLEALSQIPNVHGVLVGDALFGEEDWVASLRARASQPDLAGRIHFLGFRRDIPELMQAMDIVVHASTSAEPFGLVIVEGMLAGRPVIATRAGGACEIVQEGVSGLLTMPGSVPELRAAIERLLADPGRAQALAAGGRSRAVEAFSVEALVSRIEQVLAEL
ncbi:Glycosyltransferase involved in cell wall bisynthesis [Granulicella rosea]|uniref:Glycosyltransferase involved in cell wall bisynthesis n=1 Tax=Granulicella rosea TaxID=474952 RepID=A0A239M410_9BACT|nr:glycosyltransferase family 4 protein [Granulicella rosea]SNT37320.1 Glycosyltransferase involved in cell wall bisynthesis [Granulicella rosea]